MSCSHWRKMPGECQGSEVRVGTLVGDQARKAGVTLVTTGYKQGLRTIISTLRPFIRYLVNHVSVDEPIDLSGVSGIVPNGFYGSPEGGPSHDITATIFFKSCTPIFIFCFATLHIFTMVTTKRSCSHLKNPTYLALIQAVLECVRPFFHTHGITPRICVAGDQTCTSV